MRRIKVFDTTLRDGEQTPGVSLNLHEKVEIGRQLAKLGVDVIEAGFAIASPGDFESIKAVSENVKGVTVASLARAVENDIDRAWEAIKGAENPRIHTFIATSDIHLKYKLKMTEDEALERAIRMVQYAKQFCSDIEFSAEDASRTRPEYLYRVVQAVIKAGATVVNIPDTVGYSTPYEFGNLIKGIRENVYEIENIDLSVHCHNDLGLAVANTLAAIENGATQIESTVNGLGERAGNAAVEEVIMALNTRKDFYNIDNKIDTTLIYRTSNLVSHLTGIYVQPNKAIVGANAFAHESGIHQHGVLAQKSTYEIMTPESIGLVKNKMILGKLSGKHAFEDRLKELGFENLSEEDIMKAFKKFKDLADKKKEITDRDIEALIEGNVSSVKEIYEVESFQVLDGNKILSTATISLKKDDEVISEASTGDGPVDAAFNAIDKIVGCKLKLDDYSLRSVTEGKDALGEVTIRVVSETEGKAIGRGVSTDVIEASIFAYINAINRLKSAD